MAPGLVGLYCNVTEGINIKEKRKKQREKSWYKRKDDKGP